jgi:hypothetical protein
MEKVNGIVKTPDGDFHINNQGRFLFDTPNIVNEVRTLLMELTRNDKQD